MGAGLRRDDKDNAAPPPPPPPPLHPRQHPPKTPHLLEMPSSKTGGARPPDVEEALSVRYYDWIAHFGRRTPDKIAAIDLASQRRLSYTELDARISLLATHL